MDGNYNNNQNFYNYPPQNNVYIPQRENSFITVSLIFGITAIVSVISIFFPFIFGGLGILFALLSKGNDKQMTGKAKAGLITSLLGMSFSAFIVIASFVIVFSNPESRALFYEEYDKAYEQQYGTSFEEDFDWR